MANTGNRYDTEFKKKAIIWSRQPGHTIAETAKYFDISDQTLRNWINKGHHIKRADRLRVKQLEKELKETKRRLNEVERMNQLLVKTTALCVEKSKETTN